MKKHTSKSVSETPKTSAPSGTSAPVAATASNGTKKTRRAGKYARVVARIDGMTAEQFRQSLVAAGIVTAAGGLSEKYKRRGK
jgi:hypothetical protein